MRKLREDADSVRTAIDNNGCICQHRFPPSNILITISRIFDDANSCSRRSQELLDRITDTAATLESTSEAA